MYAYTCTCTYDVINVCTCTCIYDVISVCTCTCMHVLIHTYILVHV